MRDSLRGSSPQPCYLPSWRVLKQFMLVLKDFCCPVLYAGRSIHDLGQKDILECEIQRNFKTPNRLAS